MILVGAILGAVTGTVAASVITMGVISLPIMLRYGYDMRLATGVIAASGTITQLIPPSLVLIVLADQLGRRWATCISAPSARRSLQVADLPPLHPRRVASSARSTMPPLPPEARGDARLAAGRQVLWGIVPSLVLIFLVLGTIFMGLATPTESGALGVVGAMVLAR